jgi:uncharacterized protein YeaO (DUF488 family)
MNKNYKRRNNDIWDKYHDSQYFEIGEEHCNPFTHRIIKVGSRTFSKVYVKFGDEVLYRHLVLNKPQKSIKKAIKEYLNEKAQKIKIIKKHEIKLPESIKEPEIKFQLLDHAFQKSDKSYEASFDLTTFAQFKTEYSNPIKKTLVQELTEMKGIKFHVSITVQFHKTSIKHNKDGVMEEITTTTIQYISTKTIMH